jgi:hypothetical protein
LASTTSRRSGRTSMNFDMASIQSSTM